MNRREKICWSLVDQEDHLSYYYGGYEALKAEDL